MFFSGSLATAVKIECVVEQTYGKCSFFSPFSSVGFMFMLSLMNVVMLLPAGHSVIF